MKTRHKKKARSEKAFYSFNSVDKLLMIRSQFSLTIFTHSISILPIEFTMMHFSQSHCGVFNDIYCRSLKIAKRFSIANNCKATNQIKRTRNKNRYEKKAKSKTLQDREKPNFKLFVIFKTPEFLTWFYIQRLSTYFGNNQILNRRNKVRKTFSTLVSFLPILFGSLKRVSF